MTGLNGKIECRICGEAAHFMELHLAKAHDMTVEVYRGSYPDAPVVSGFAKAHLAELEAKSRNGMIDFDIQKTFGVKVSEKVTTTRGFEHPHSTTPATDPDYQFRKEHLQVILFGWTNPSEVTLLTGPTGSGKSSVIEQVAARLNVPYYRVNMDSDITRADFVGKDVLKEDHTEFQYGFLPRAMKEGAWLEVDEWDCANPGVAMVLQAVLEGKPLVLSETGEVIYPSENFRIWATSNTAGQGDESGLYNGTQPQNFASLDRFTQVEYVDYPDKRTEAKILQAKTGIADKDIVDKFLKVAGLVRDNFLKEEINVTMSTRTIVNVARKLLAFGDVKRAYELAFLNKCNSGDRKVVSELIQRVWAV